MKPEHVKVDFYAVFWGREFADIFLSLCLSSLLGADRWDEFSRNYNCKLLLCMPGEDWRDIQAHPIFTRAKAFLEIVHVEHRYPLPDESDMGCMSAGHKALTEMIFEESAIGIYLSPDAVLGKEFLVRCDQYIREGYDLAVLPIFRSSMESILPILSGKRSDDGSLSVSSQDLAKWSFQEPHPETMSRFFDGKEFANFPIMCMWRLPSGNILGLSFSWWPIIIDYRKLSEHNSKVLDSWTIDGDYLHANFGNAGRKYVVSDSEELFITSLTSSSERGAQLGIAFMDWLPLIRYWSRLLAIGRVYSDPLIDPLKRELFLQQVFYKTSLERDDSVILERQRAEVERVAKFVADHHTNKLFIFFVAANKYLREGVLKHGMYWLRKRMGRLVGSNSGT